VFGCDWFWSNYSDVTRPQKVADEGKSSYFRKIQVGEIFIVWPVDCVWGCILGGSKLQTSQFVERHLKAKSLEYRDYHPWDWYICLHEWLILVVNVQGSLNYLFWVDQTMRNVL